MEVQGSAEGSLWSWVQGGAKAPSVVSPAKRGRVRDWSCSGASRLRWGSMGESAVSPGETAEGRFLGTKNISRYPFFSCCRRGSLTGG